MSSPLLFDFSEGFVFYINFRVGFSGLMQNITVILMELH